MKSILPKSNDFTMQIKAPVDQRKFGCRRQTYSGTWSILQPPCTLHLPNVWLQEKRWHVSLRLSHRIASFVRLSVLVFNYVRSFWPLVSSWDITSAQLCRDGELIPGESKQEVNAKIYHYEIAYKSSVVFFLKGSNRQDLIMYWWEGLS